MQYTAYKYSSKRPTITGHKIPAVKNVSVPLVIEKLNNSSCSFFSEPAPEFTPAKAGEGRGGEIKSVLIGVNVVILAQAGTVSKFSVSLGVLCG
jgi:hypothetical protein